MENRRYLQHKNDGEWAAVINAQAATTKFLQEEEKQLQALSKKLYKEELDRQIREKVSNKMQTVEELNKERQFLSAQQIAMQNFEARRRNEDKSFQDVFSKEYSNEISEKQRKINQEREAAIAKEQERIRKAQFDLEFEQQRMLENKMRSVSLEREALMKQQEEKRRLQELKEAEKYKDKIEIERNMKEMEAKERAFRDFYNKRLEEQERKFRNYRAIPNEKGVYETEMRNKEWERIVLERAALKEQFERNMKDKAMSDMKTELNRQIEARKREKELEYLESIREQERARNNARQVEFQSAVENERRLREKRELQEALEKQLTEKQRNFRTQEEMDEIEKRYNMNILKSIEKQNKIAFPGVPGIHSTESPIKQQFAKVYLNKGYETAESSERISVNQSYENGRRVSRSVGGDPVNRRNVFYWPDPNQHNPITNPIGSNAPRIMPGQRLPKGNNGSRSKLAVAANSIFG
ncbi:unnamed protein product [Blepharisma stoltei]|uniref:Trichohyalin-plectin-homology domain-containing protein n=1 Tax=Blepharisma stoltei TaxID=1481888 RepID=A0AAU9J2J5_9CILI|nr:unnamed protein product [Blepharisma stoltei]